MTGNKKPKKSMANRRMISKSISTSTKLADVSTFAKLLFTWLIPHCDDYGRMEANPRIVKAIVVPLCDEGVEEVGKALSELSKIGLIKTYTYEDREYLEIIKWEAHQTFKTDRPRVELFPAGNQRKPAETKRKNCPTKLREVKLREVKLREEKRETPIHSFFKDSKLQEEMIEKIISKGLPETDTRKEVKKFIAYWTETNARGKQRWEAEKFFDLNRRLATWFSNWQKFNQNKGHAPRISSAL